MKRISLGLLLVAGALSAQTQLTNLPTIYLTTDNAASIHKDSYTSGTIQVVFNDTTKSLPLQHFQIKGRGNSTWNMSKKPYSICLDAPMHFVGLNAAATKWEFIADYADKSLMRGATAFHLGKYMGFEFTPDEQFADVYLNGTYQGNYHITDHMEAAPDRVPVKVENPRKTAANECGYFLEVDGWASSEPHYFYTTKNMPITIHYPESPTGAQTTFIKNFIQDFENRLFATNFTDPVEGYRAVVDTVSLINWYVAIEIVGNSDAFWSSFIYRKPSDDHLYFGPLWDYDIAFNNDDRLGEATQKVMRESAHNPRTWITRLWQDDWFKRAANRRLQQLINGGVEEELCQFIDQKYNELQASAAKNFERWNNLSTHNYHEVRLFSTYQETVSYLKTYIHERLIFLQANFSDAAGEPIEQPSELAQVASRCNICGTVLNMPAGEKTVRVFSATGALLSTVSTQSQTLDLQQFTSAYYLISVTTTTHSYTLPYIR